MEGLPVQAVPVPVEARPDALVPNLEVLTQAVDHPLERGRPLWVLADQVRALVPRDPLAPTHILLVKGAHLLDEPVVERPVSLLTEELGNYDDCSVSRECFRFDRLRVCKVHSKMDIKTFVQYGARKKEPRYNDRTRLLTYRRRA